MSSEDAASTFKISAACIKVAYIPHKLTVISPLTLLIIKKLTSHAYQNIGESVGVQANEEAAAKLAEDVEFRIREVIQVHSPPTADTSRSTHETKQLLLFLQFLGFSISNIP